MCVCVCVVAVPSLRQHGERQYVSLQTAAIYCHLSPSSRKATGNVEGQERMQFILLSSWFGKRQTLTEEEGVAAGSKALGLIQKRMGKSQRGRRGSWGGKNEKREQRKMQIELKDYSCLNLGFIIPNSTVLTKLITRICECGNIA